MTDDPNKRHPVYVSKISLAEKWEAAYWVEELVTTEVRLRQVIALVGNNTERVREHLKRNKEVRFQPKPKR